MVSSLGRSRRSLDRLYTEQNHFLFLTFTFALASQRVSREEQASCIYINL